jgi:hypothetical protein
MKKHEILSPQYRAALFDPPTNPAAIVRHYTFSSEDMKLIRRRRRDANRLGFAVLLAYLRFPGRVLGAQEVPPPDMLDFVASQVGSEAKAFAGYAQRDETRWEHLGELQNYLGVRPFQRHDYRATAKVALDEAIGSDRGEAIVAAQISHLRRHGILSPAATILERIGLAARARARKQAHKNLVEGLEHKTIAGLEALIAVESDRDRTLLAWLREWPEAPSQRNIAGVVKRLQTIRNLGVGADREQRIHRARYAAIARETAQHLSRFDASRRLRIALICDGEGERGGLSWRHAGQP